MVSDKWSMIGKLLKMVQPLAGKMVLAVILGVCGHLAAIMIPVLGAYGILNALGYHSHFTLSKLALIVLVLAILRGFLRYGEQACNHDIAFRLLAHIRDLVFGQLRKLAPARLEGRDKGDLISVLTSDIELLEVFFAHTISPVAIACCISLLMAGLMASGHVLLGLWALLCYVGIGVGLPLWIARQDQQQSLLAREQVGQLSAFVLDSLRGLSEVLQYHQQQQRLDILQQRSQNLKQTQGKTKVVQAKNQALCTAVIHFCSIIMLLLASWLYLHQALTFDQLLWRFVAFISSFGPVIALANLGSGLQPTLAAAKRVQDLLEEEPQVCDNVIGSQPTAHDIACRDVSFSYDDKTELLSQIDMTLPASQIIGIAGRSGSGKSTLLKLMMRFWESTKGDILIGGANVSVIQTDHLRKMESYVTQETVLFHDTIENNVRIAKVDATREEVEAACQLAGIHDFILSLPQGYATNIGELGDALSGGEKQRLGLTRAFLHDAPIILLDEPTSDLDSINEALILQSLLKQGKQKTTVLVSHRAFTLKIADLVYRIDSGRLS